MGFLLKFAIFAVAGYVVWTSAKRMLGLSSDKRPPVPPPQRPSQSSPTVVADTKQCRACGAFVAVGAGRCGRADCPQPA
jgi:hypothetical protein